VLQKLLELCVHRRLAVIAFTLAIGVYGFNAYLRTPIEAFPDVTNVQVTVIGQLPGLAAEEVERQISVPLERALNGTPGMIGMRSESLFGLSLITLVFDDDADSFRSRAFVSERIATASTPKDASIELAPNATPLGKIYQYRLLSPRHDLYQLRAEQEFTVTRVLKQVPGVADVVSFGGYLKEFHVEVDPEKLLAMGVTLDDVVEALEKSNRNAGGGFVRRGDQELVIRSVGYLSGPRDIEHVVLKAEGGAPVTVGDVAHVVQSSTPRRGSVAQNEDREIVEGVVLLRRGENPSDVLAGIHDKVDQLNASILPKGMKVEAHYDRTELVSHTLATVHHNLLEGALLIIAVVWLFLRSIRGALIVTAVIPLALLVAFAGLYLLGLPANLISMGAIDFGILVDGAVILVERVVHELRHHRPKTKKEMRAIIAHSALDVARPTLFAMSIIIAALIPVFTLQRVEGRIFRPLAMTYSFALLGALVFSLTVVPALCAVFMRPADAEVKDPAFIGLLTRLYERVLGWFLRFRFAAFVLCGALLAGGAVMGAGLGTEFLPQLDEGDVFVFTEMPPSIALEKAQDVLAEVRRRLMVFPEVRAVLTEHGRPEDGTDNEGSNIGQTAVRFLPKEQWRKGLKKKELVEQMRKSLADIPGARFNFSQPIKDRVEEAVSGVRGQVVIKIFGTDFDVMRTTLKKSIATLSQIKGIVDLDLYRDALVPQLQIKLNREALAREGISVGAAQEHVEAALAGRVVTELWEGERPVPVRVRLPNIDKSSTDRIASMLLPTPSGNQVPLKQVATVGTANGRGSINRESNSRFAALKFNVEGRDLGSVIKEAMAAVKKDVPVPDGYSMVWAGEFENQQRAMGRLAVIIPIAMVVVLALLYAALGSARAALTVLGVAPFAMTGGIFGLSIMHIPLSVSATIGFIALLGQVSLSGLLVLSAIDMERKAGKPPIQAALEGALTRMRAVLMASLLAMLGLMPMVVSEEVGSETQRPFATAIVGGMVTTLIVALIVLPVLYSLIATKKVHDYDADED
jgi:cobalt-zinc-cadmium resistance protein CzcA